MATKYNPMDYVQIAKPAAYKSAYQGKLDASRNQILNFKYNPMQDANYQALAKIYGARGNQAAKDTLGEAAALNGGFGTSYAVSAAQQARNQYNQELAALIPDLEQNAYSRLQSNYNVLMDADADAYKKYRDNVADYQWGKGLDMDIYQYNDSKKGSGGGGGGGSRRSSGGGGGYSGGGGSVISGGGSTGGRPGSNWNGTMTVSLKTSGSKSTGKKSTGRTNKTIKTNKNTIWWGGKAR